MRLPPDSDFSALLYATIFPIDDTLLNEASDNNSDGVVQLLSRKHNRECLCVQYLLVVIWKNFFKMLPVYEAGSDRTAPVSMNIIKLQLECYLFDCFFF